MLPIPIEYLHSVCEIKTMENALIATGIISQIEQDFVQINEKNSIFPLLSYGTMIKVNIFNSHVGFRVIVGNVLATSIRFVKLVDVSSLLDYERRNFFRIEADQVAHIVKQNATAGYDIINNIMIRDISLGGLLFDCKSANFEDGQKLLIKIKLTRMSTVLCCRIKRLITTKTGVAQYGCEFEGVSEVQTDAICSYIFQRQRERINKNKALNEQNALNAGG